MTTTLALQWMDRWRDDVQERIAYVGDLEVVAVRVADNVWQVQITRVLEDNTPLVAEHHDVRDWAAVERWVRKQVRRVQRAEHAPSLVAAQPARWDAQPSLFEYGVGDDNFWDTFDDDETVFVERALQPVHYRSWSPGRWKRAPHTSTRSYWLVEHEIRCGAYPGALTTAEATDQLGALLDLGCTTFIDLTERGELAPYADQLLALGQERDVPVVYVRHPIIDVSTPTVRELEGILDTIDAARTMQRTVFMHCRGGVGRTGTVAGCYLVRHGARPKEALAQIERTRAGMYNGYKRSPETLAQERMIRQWRRGQ